MFLLAKGKWPTDFGERPNKTLFDIDGDLKTRNLADPPFTPFKLTKKGYDDCMMLMCHYICVVYCLRGATDVSMLIVDLFKYLAFIRTNQSISFFPSCESLTQPLFTGEKESRE